MSLRKGDRVRVFDNELWAGRDVGNNSQFYMPATIEWVHEDRDGAPMVDVRFDHRPENVSYGHFLHAVAEKLPGLAGANTQSQPDPRRQEALDYANRCDDRE